MPDYLFLLLTFVALVGVAMLPWEALETARPLPQRAPNEKE